jgi:glycosyltransferase involved in cell wall biosynthesis
VKIAPRVLVVAYDFPPHGAIGTLRTLRVVRQLSARGWDVTVLTSDPAHFRPSTPIEPALLAQVPPGVTVLRAGPIRLRRGSPRAGSTSSPTLITGNAPSPAAAPARAGGVKTIRNVLDAALSIPDREVGWLLPAFWMGLRQRFRSGAFDVIYSSAPPWTGQLVAYALKLALRRPWVADFRDPWGRAPWRGDRFRFAIRAASFLERRVVKRTDRMVFVAEGNRDDFAAQYGARIAEKFRLVSNGCDPAEIDALEKPAVPADGVHVMLHAGSLYAGRTPVPVFKAVAQALDKGLLNRGSFRLRFLGSSVVSTDLPDTCRELRIADLVEFHPRVPRQEGLRAMLTANSLLLLQPGHTVSVPGKIYEYLAVGRPIFALAEGESADVVRRSGIGVAVDTYDDVHAIMEGLVRIVEMSKGPVPAPPREMYDGNLGAAAIEQIIKEAVGGR